MTLPEPSSRLSGGLRAVSWDWSGPSVAPFVALDYLAGPPVGIYPCRVYMDPGDPCGWAVADSAGGVTFGECEPYALLRWLHRDVERVVCEQPPSGLTIYRPEPHLVVGALIYVCTELGIPLVFQGREVRVTPKLWLRLARAKRGEALSPHSRDALLLLVYDRVVGPRSERDVR